MMADELVDRKMMLEATNASAALAPFEVAAKQQNTPSAAPLGDALTMWENKSINALGHHKIETCILFALLKVASHSPQVDDGGRASLQEDDAPGLTTSARLCTLQADHRARPTKPSREHTLAMIHNLLASAGHH